MPVKKITKTKAAKSPSVILSPALPDEGSKTEKAKTLKSKPSSSKKSPIVVLKTTSLTVKVFDIQGKSTGTVSLPKEIFGQIPNKNLLMQAIRIYSANSSKHTAHTKTRGEVHGGGVKPWRQKGTGRARAGSIRSPLWVGGGTTFGPRYKQIKLSLPQKMRHKALIFALSDKAKSGEIKVITDLEKISPKTKTVANLLKKLEVKKDALIIISQKTPNVNLASRNIPNISVNIAANLNAYEVLKNNQLLISKDAISKFK